MRRTCWAIVLGVQGLLVAAVHGETPTQDLEFFEKRVRPILAEHCYECHGPEKQKAGLRWDHIEFALEGGERGPALVPGEPDESRMIEAISYANPDLQMPPEGRLDEDQIETLRRWVEMGAPWPEEPKPEAGQNDGEGFDLQKRRREHWAWQPLKDPVPPEVEDTDWPRSPIDRFLLRKLEADGLEPVEEADKRTLIRRLYFDLTGLPPSPEAVERFANDESSDAYEKLVDRLLDSPRFGERWARHWLDLMRYAETRGHEFDYPIPGAYQYRDYVIRALNRDVPYDQFVTEHIAGDLLDEPRLHPTEGFNESVLGTGFWFLGEWVHSPVDIREDETDRFDNMIDVMGKSFLGLTVGCARCHDHKFDAISDEDYYALLGHLQSSNYRQVRFETLPHNREIAERLRTVEREHRPRVLRAVAKAQQPVLGQLDRYLLAAREALQSDGPIVRRNRPDIVFEDFESERFGDRWTAEGEAFAEGPIAGTHPDGQQKVSGFEGDRLVNTWVGTDGVIGTLTSEPFTIRRRHIRFLIGGGGHGEATSINLIIDGEAVRTATGRNDERLTPRQWNVSEYEGREAHIRIVDEHTGGWGHVNVDHIVFTDEPAGKADRAITRDRFSNNFRDRLDRLTAREKLDPDVLAAWTAHLANAAETPDDPLHPWALAAQEDESVRDVLERLTEARRQQANKARKTQRGLNVEFDFSEAGSERWMTDGLTFGSGPTQPGDVRFSDDPAAPIRRILSDSAARKRPRWDVLTLKPGTERDPGRLAAYHRPGRMVRTSTFEIQSGRIHYKVRGSGLAYAVVDSHRMNNGPLHGRLIKTFKGNDEGFRRVTHDLSRYEGHRAHIEFSPLEDEHLKPGHSDALAVQQVVQQPSKPKQIPQPIGPLLQVLEDAGADPSPEALAAGYRELFERVSARLAEDRLHAEPNAAGHAELADWMVRHGALFGLDRPEARRRLTEAASSMMAERRSLQQRIRPASRTAPAMMDGDPENERLLIRGNHEDPGHPVERRYLEALGGKQRSTPDHGSGRLELARQMTDPEQTPLLPRVFANRVWHHLFGRGIVKTVDNFGALGEPPTHPELLDWLARRFVRDGWSIKQLIRRIVTSRAYRMSSTQHDGRAERIDPKNKLLHRANVRRLEGEAIRDAILTASGRLNEKAQGPSVPVHLTPFMNGRGRPSESGPLDGNGRRSIYTEIRRNFLPPMMLAFDMPIPFNTVGRRNVSNVPAQALVLMNSPFVDQQAEVWAERTLREHPDRTVEERIDRLYRAALARPPSEDELAEARAFIERQGEMMGVPAEQRSSHPGLWADFCHVLFNVKEFIFLR